MDHDRSESHAIKEQALKGLLDVELCIEDDEAEGDGEGVVGGMKLEKGADGVEGSVVGVVGLVWGKMGERSAASGRLAARGARRRVRGQRRHSTSGPLPAPSIALPPDTTDARPGSAHLAPESHCHRTPPMPSRAVHDLPQSTMRLDDADAPQQPDALLVLLPLLIVLSSFLFLLLVFLVCVLIIRRRRGIVLRDSDGPVDMSREELIDSEGGFDALEARWLESVPDHVRRDYSRAKGMFCSCLRKPPS